MVMFCDFMFSTLVLYIYIPYYTIPYTRDSTNDISTQLVYFMVLLMVHKNKITKNLFWFEVNESRGIIIISFT
jgi:hypothetical protein